MKSEKISKGTETKQSLIALVQKRIVTDPVMVNGVAYAVCPQVLCCEALGISIKTLGRYTSKPPFDRKVRKIGDEMQMIDGKTVLVGGKVTCLLRIGEAQPDEASGESGEGFKRQLGSRDSRHPKRRFCV